MDFRIVKKSDEKYLLLMNEEKKVNGVYLTKSELKVLQNNINEILEYDKGFVGVEI